MLLMSTPIFAQELQEPTLTPYQKAEQALEYGRFDEVETWFQGLSSREQRTLPHLTLAALSAINSYDLDLAGERLRALEKLRLRSEEDIAVRSAVIAHYNKVERLLSNSRTVETNAILTAERKSALQELSKLTAAYGQVTADSYTSPDGKTLWEVGLGTDSIPVFYVTHKLGNGRWDTANREIVTIPGIPDDAVLSYPYLKGDGATLYFSIEQRAKIPTDVIGRKDIYVSRYDRESHSLLVPTQLSLPFNSSSDDFYYIIDSATDQGWMLSDRGLSPDSLRLYTFRPSSLTRYEGDDLAVIASWSHPVIVAGTAKDPLTPNMRRADERPIYFWIGDQAVREPSDLGSPQAEMAFTEYLKHHRQVTQIQDRLTQLRNELHQHPQKMQDSALRQEILTLERQLLSSQKALEAIRNEVIRLSQTP